MEPIRISANGRYFIEQSGEPFFWLGDTLWELFLEVSAAEAEEILAIRKRQGFTVAQVMITGVGDGTKPSLAGETPWTNNDPATPNEAYFRNMDAVVEAAERQGIVLVLGVFHQLQVEIITTENARAYARWLAERYRDAPNIIWTMYPQAKMEYLPVLRELAAGLREGDGGSHLITVHPDPSPTSSSFIHEESWLDFNMIQPCVTYELIYEMVRADYLRTPVKPTVMAEGGYEGLEFDRLQTPLEIRKQAYWSHLPGGHHSYGHNDCWVAPRQWREWIHAPGAIQMGIYRDILTACREWWNWIPDQSLFAEGEGSGLTLNVAARAAASDWAVIYLSSPTTVTLRLDKLTAGDTVQADWIDPTNGAITALGTFPNTGTQAFSTPAGWQDAVLRLNAL